MNNTIVAKLESMFASIREQAYNRLLESRMRWAVAAHESFTAALAGPPRSLLYFRRPEYTLSSASVVMAPGYGATNEERWAYMAQQRWYLAEENVRRDAKLCIDEMGRMFVLRVGQKLSDATKLQQTDPTTRGNIAVDWPAVVGDVDLVYPDCSLVANVKVITNYRNGNPYYQFPCRFKTATIRGEIKVAPSLDWLEGNFV